MLIRILIKSKHLLTVPSRVVARECFLFLDSPFPKKPHDFFLWPTALHLHPALVLFDRIFKGGSCGQAAHFPGMCSAAWGFGKTLEKSK